MNRRFETSPARRPGKPRDSTWKRHSSGTSARSALRPRSLPMMCVPLRPVAADEDDGRVAPAARLSRDALHERGEMRLVSEGVVIDVAITGAADGHVARRRGRGVAAIPPSQTRRVDPRAAARASSDRPRCTATLTRAGVGTARTPRRPPGPLALVGEVHAVERRRQARCSSPPRSRCSGTWELYWSESRQWPVPEPQGLRRGRGGVEGQRLRPADRAPR